MSYSPGMPSAGRRNWDNMALASVTLADAAAERASLSILRAAGMMPSLASNASRRACSFAAPDSARTRANSPCKAMKSRLCTRNNGCPRRTCSPSSTSTRVTTPANGTVTWVVVASGDIASAGSPVTGTSVAARLRSVLMPRLRSC